MFLRSNAAPLLAVLTALCLAPAAGRADEDVQAHPKELTGPGTKGSPLKVNPKENPAAMKAAPAAARAAQGETAAKAKPEAVKAAPRAAEGK